MVRINRALPAASAETEQAYAVTVVCRVKTRWGLAAVLGRWQKTRKEPKAAKVTIPKRPRNGQVPFISLERSRYIARSS